MGHPQHTLNYRFLINEEEFQTDDRILTGRNVLTIADCSPPSDFSVVVYRSGGTEQLALDGVLDLKETIPTIKIFKTDRLFRAILNEREIVWGDRDISAANLRHIGNIALDQDLFLDSEGDRPIADDSSVKLSREGVERIRSGDPKDTEVDIILNGQQKTVGKGKLSFAELAELAFPDLFGREQVCFTVSFSKGPKRRPQGPLIEGGKIRVVEGMIFNVTATDKS